MLISKLAPALGASLAGLMLAVYPSEQLRTTAAIYVFSRAVEFLYNKFDSEGYLDKKPWVSYWKTLSLDQQLIRMQTVVGQLAHYAVRLWSTPSRFRVRS
jgi:hypothetical protein